MRLVDAEQQRLLERLQGEEPVALGELRASGIGFSAIVVSEAELSGYAIERVSTEGRLIGIRLRGRRPRSCGPNAVRVRRPPSGCRSA
jgi:hypothetical protein